jgi:predicted DsbA family dithiol-disulfide isomerase
MEPAIRKLKADLHAHVRWRNCMGGLLPSWNDFSDTLNNVSRPIQMGPVWMHAGQITGAPIDQNIWYRDPPASSYPACIAVKAVEAQSIQAADVYLSMVREACLKNGVNIGKAKELIKLASPLHIDFPFIDLVKFKHDFTKGEGVNAFKSDLEEIRIRKIKRFPTLIFRKPGKESLITTGFRTYEALAEIILSMDPSLEDLIHIKKSPKNEISPGQPN